MFTLITHANVYAPQPMGICHVLVCFNRIVAIGKELTCPWPHTVIDAEGRTLIPGLIDQHVHITGGGGEQSFQSRAPRVELEDCVTSGVTTLVGLLGTDSITRSVASVVAQAKALGEQGLTAYCLTGAYEYPSPTLTGSVKKDIAFIQEVIGVKIAISDHRSSSITAAELARLASEVRQAALISGKVGEVHMHLGNGKQGLADVFRVLEETDIPIGHFRPTHIQKILDQGIAFANQGGYIDFTSGEPKGAAQAMLKAYEAAPADRITLSSDANGSQPVWNEKGELIGMGVASMDTLLQCVAELCAAGMPLEEALRPVTSTVAQALGLAGRKGHIQAGADADLVLLSERLTPHMVMARGQILMDQGKVLKKGFFA